MQVWAYIIFYVWASALLFLDEVGNARRLDEWDEQLVQQPTLFCIMYQTTIYYYKTVLQRVATRHNGVACPNVIIMEQKNLQLVYFNSRDKLIRLDVHKITYFEADGNYTYIVTTNKQKACLTMNLSHTEEALATQMENVSGQFMRIGKRFIVNMNYIYQIDIQKQVLLLSDWKHFIFQLPISKDALKSVRELIIKIKI